jgi:magnesium-transporting ATPase (P-type)
LVFLQEGDVIPADGVLVEGSRRARLVAAETLGRVREAMKVVYR